MVISRFFLVSPMRDDAGDLGQHGLTLRLARLEQFLDAGKTLRDVLAGRDAAGVEGTHGQLRAGLADGLRGDDTDGLADINVAAVGQVRAVARAHTPVSLRQVSTVRMFTA